MTQRKNVDIGPVITMMRNAYRLVKIAPFIYAMIYIMCLFGYLMFNDTVSAMIDVLCYISPVPQASAPVRVQADTAFQRRLHKLLRLRLSESAVGEALSFSIGAIGSPQWPPLSCTACCFPFRAHRRVH